MSTRTRKDVAKLVAVPVGLLVSGALVLGFSNAAFTAQTSNEGNTWSTGSISLDNNLTEPMFGVEDGPWVPGATVTETIEISYTSDLPAEISLFGVPGADPAGVADHLELVVNDGTADVFTGTLGSFMTTHSDWANGAGTWLPTPGETRTFSFTMTLADDAPAAVQGSAIADTSFTWEARTTTEP